MEDNENGFKVEKGHFTVYITYGIGEHLEINFFSKEGFSVSFSLSTSKYNLNPSNSSQMNTAFWKFYKEKIHAMGIFSDDIDSLLNESFELEKFCVNALKEEE